MDDPQIIKDKRQSGTWTWNPQPNNRGNGLQNFPILRYDALIGRGQPNQESSQFVSWFDQDQGQNRQRINPRFGTKEQENFDQRRLYLDNNISPVQVRAQIKVIG